MSIFDGMRINASGLTLERFKLDTISTNIANVNTTRVENGDGPYIKQQVEFEESLRTQTSGFTGDTTTSSAGVRITGVEADEENVKMVYEPEHPDADENGYVAYPNVDMADEMVEMMTAIRTYDANVTAINNNKDMLKRALEIGK
ncbi:flagellar basal body rod protein FlgC [Marinilactibacillus sp. 15R]|uniref:Flagellar basal-body rod protein FlgC n=1 Tax=Marinilactibacillus piezotolerans TaxID=258723 RepID=A0A1I3V7W5_9LACT|nr:MULTISPECIES: flagellar basal body rod protein FlgC [Marinilactibacillus]API89635.1 flagellar basal body rod protein FlgC [Marinilactibacillus sp. 15R]SFJ91252.1 flagellar basal-body rod protein FlgC [Marinilactibacillus piezotolerans]